MTKTCSLQNKSPPFCPSAVEGARGSACFATVTKLATWGLLALSAVAWADGNEARSRLVSDQGDSRAEGATSPMEKDVTIIENLGELVPKQLEFTTHEGVKVKLGDLMSGRRPVVITPVYYACPTLCNVVLQGVAATLKSSGLKLGEDYDLISYSIDPKETPALAAEKRLKLIHDLGYMSGITDWPFLVSDEATSRALSESLGFRYKYDADIKQYAHSAAFMVLTPDGRISRYLYGVRFAPKDTRLALVEASQGKAGTAFDRFLLTCYRFDPASRRYEFMLQAYLKGGALLFFFALLTMLTVFWRRELKYGSGRKPPPTTPQGAPS